MTVAVVSTIVVEISRCTRVWTDETGTVSTWKEFGRNFEVIPGTKVHIPSVAQKPRIYPKSPIYRYYVCLTHVLEDVHVRDCVLKLPRLGHSDEVSDVGNHSVHWINALRLPCQGNLEETMGKIKYLLIQGILCFSFRRFEKNFSEFLDNADRVPKINMTKVFSLPFTRKTDALHLHILKPSKYAIA